MHVIRRQRRVDANVSMMSTHPQWEKSGFPELQNAYAQKCGRIPYAVGNIYPTFPHPPNFSSWRRHAIIWILLKFSIIS